MSRAHAIETRLEKLLPSLEEYFTSGFLSREETHDVARERNHWEYRLVARPLLLLDVQNAVAYELELEKRLHEYCSTTKLVLRHRWAVLERIESIYRIAIKNLKNREEMELIRKEFIQFLKDHKRQSTLSAFYGELMVQYPTRTLLWVEAALYEGIEVGNTDNGRAIVQQAIITNANEPEVWNAAFLLELYFADRLLLGLVEESQNEQQRHEERSKHDIVNALQVENAALANVVVDLALAKTVLEEAFESPACGQKLVQLLLDSAMRFSYTKPLLDILMTSAALNMLSALTATSKDGRIKDSLQKWSKVGVSTFLHDYLTLDVLMADRGVTGDAASYLRSNGRTHSATPAERSAALVKAFSAALTLAQMEIDASPSVVRQLRDAAVAVMETVLEALQHTAAPVGGAISTLCRRLLSGQRLDAVEAVRCLRRHADASLLRELAQTPADRVQALFQRVCLAPGRRKKTKLEDHKAENKFWQLWRFLSPEDRRAVETLVPLRASAPCATIDDVEQLIVFQRNAQDGAAVGLAVRRFLGEFDLIGDGELLEGIKRLRYSEAKTPVTFWKVFQLLELRCETREPHARSRGSSVGSASDGGSEDEEENVAGVPGINDDSYAAAGLKFLASVPCGSLDRAAEEERLEGCWGLLSARMQTLTGLNGGSGTTRADFISCLQRCSSDAWVEGMRSVLSVARLCEPLPRQVLAEIAIPFLEAVALERGGSRALQEAREAHETLIGMYSLSQHLGSFLPLVHHVPRSKEGKHTRLSPCELNALDWARLVAFERGVAKDLRRAKETAARAKRVALEPQRLLAMLSAY